LLSKFTLLLSKLCPMLLGDLDEFFAKMSTMCIT
jgi:hypothetical protein